MHNAKNQIKGNTPNIAFFGLALFVIGLFKLIDFFLDLSEFSWSLMGTVVAAILNCVVGLYFILTARKK